MGWYMKRPIEGVEVKELDHTTLSRRSFVGLGLFAAAAMALSGSSILSLMSAEEAHGVQTHFEGAWNPPPITNSGWIYIEPHIKVVIDYEPGDDYMKVTCSRISCSHDGDSDDGEGFWDGFGITTPPDPGGIGPYYTYDGGDTASAAESQLRAWCTQGGRTCIWGAAQSNCNSRWDSNNIEFGYIIDHASYTFNLDVSGYSPGDDPVVLVMCNRWREVTSDYGDAQAWVTFHSNMRASDLGITIRVRPKIIATADTGGSISPPGTTYVDYDGDQSYTITPSKYWKIKDVKVDGSSVGKVSTYKFTHVQVDHRIHASFEPITGTLRVQKRDKATNSTTPQGNASFNQTKWTVTCVDSPHYTNGSVVATLTADASGAASVTLKGGKFKVKETTASATYNLTDTAEREFDLATDGQSVNYNGTSNSFNNYVERGGVQLKKGDEDWGSVNAQGNGTIQGAVFKIYNVSENAITMGSTSYMTHKARKKSSAAGNYGSLKYGEYDIDPSSSSYNPCLTLTTDANGYVTSGNESLPVGTYVIFEVTPPTGYRLNSQLAQGVTFNITDLHDMVSFTS